MLYWDLFWSFVQVGLFSVGGGYASMPMIQAQVVDYHQWLTMSELIDVFALSQMTPGPIGINAATFVGARQVGIGGAVAATLGFVTPSVFIMLMFIQLLKRYGNIRSVKGILNGLRPTVVALIGSAAILFVTLVLWNTEHIPSDIASFNGGAAFIIALAVYFLKVQQMGIIKNLVLCGILGLVLGCMGYL